VAFINQLTHTKGRFARERFALRSWQLPIVQELFGLERPRTALLMLPRKNGKSELAAAIALYGLLGDDEVGAEVYSAAAEREQASLVFNVAANMVDNDPWLRTQCVIVHSQKRIVHVASKSVYRAISAEAYSKHGFNASMVIYDELHTAPNRELWDVLATSQGARDEPLMFAISTAGFDRKSILYELYEHGKKVQEGVVDDPTFRLFLFEAPKEADWTDEAVWHQCNPALGDFRSLEEMRIAAQRAKSIPAQENTFRRLYLNQWTEQADRWMPMTEWDACRVEIDRDALAGRRCYVGMDLSATRDLTAIVAVFPNESGFDVLPCFFLPKETLDQQSMRDRADFVEWGRRGHLVITPGNVVDFEAVRRVLNQWAERYDLRDIGYDYWNATDLVTRLSEQDKLPCSKVTQGKALQAPTKSLEMAIYARRLRHDGHPVLRWNVSNAAVEDDGFGTWKLSKKASREKIDGVMALAMAVDGMDRDPDPESVYETRGVLVL
jgi:phage terminase large subunit-like protein